MNTPAPSRAERSAFADIVTVFLVAAAAAIVVVFAAVFRMLSMFRPDGFAWTLPIDEMPVNATFGSGTGSIEGIVGEIMVISPDVNAVSMVAGAASVITWALASLIVTGMVVFVAWSFLRGRFFVPATARAFDIVGWMIVLGGVMVLGFDTMARNGVLAAVGSEGEATHPVEFWAFAPVWAIGVAICLLGLAFRRGVRMQHEMDGLV